MTITISKKALILVAAIILVLGGVVGGTVAWLTATSDTVTNTFTFGDINITLTETESTYKIVPGVDINKDPKVTVKSGSEPCYLFVKLVKSAEFSSLNLGYSLAEGWTELTANSGVYYRVVDAKSTDQIFEVLSDNKVTVPNTLTKNDITNVEPTLTITAYAVQQAGMNSATDAWNAIPANTGTGN